MEKKVGPSFQALAVLADMKGAWLSELQPGVCLSSDSIRKEWL